MPDRCQGHRLPTRKSPTSLTSGEMSSLCPLHDSKWQYGQTRPPRLNIPIKLSKPAAFRNALDNPFTTKPIPFAENGIGVGGPAAGSAKGLQEVRDQVVGVSRCRPTAESGPLAPQAVNRRRWRASSCRDARSATRQPPRDSASVKISVRPTMSTASCSPRAR